MFPLGREKVVLSRSAHSQRFPHIKMSTVIYDYTHFNVSFSVSVCQVFDKVVFPIRVNLRAVGGEVLLNDRTHTHICLLIATGYRRR